MQIPNFQKVSNGTRIARWVAWSLRTLSVLLFIAFAVGEGLEKGAT